MPHSSTPQSNPQGTPTNPLGGKVHGVDGHSRHWSGYSAFVRICPTCRDHNPEAALFCTSCGASVQNITPTPSNDARSGLENLSRRLDRERRKERRERAVESAGGQGLIVVGMAIIAGVVVVNPAREIGAPLWLVAVLLLLGGIWQLRNDPKALRSTGTLFAAVTAVALVMIGARAIQAASSADDPQPSVELPATPDVAVSGPISTPNARLAGEVIMQGVNSAHTGVMPGPAPTTTPPLAWQSDMGGELYGSPVISDGVIFATSKSGNLIATDATTGNQLWTVPITGYVTRASPTVIGDTVYVASGFSFMALDSASGAERWSIPLQYVGHASPTVVGDLIVIGSQERWIYGIERETGEFRWRLPTEGIVFGAVAMNEHAGFYATDEGIVYSISLETGRMIWRQQLAGSIYAAPVINGTSLLVTTEAGETLALDLETGTQQWTALAGGQTAPATNGDLVIVAAADGGVYGFDAATGEQRWLYPTGKQHLTAPVLVDNLVIVAAGNTLLALDVETGEAVWYYLAGDLIDSSPIVVANTIYFGTRDGFLNAIGESGG